MSKRNLVDTAALSDPTDSHSLEELRAHLEDGGDMATTDWWRIAELAGELERILDSNKDKRLDSYLMDSDTYIGQVWHGLDYLVDYAKDRASERSGGDGA